MGEPIFKAELDWDEYFMSLAVVASKRSKDRETKVGAVVVSADRKVLGIGWNGHPKMRSRDNDNKVQGHPWDKEKKHYYVCHAELNAITHSSGSLKGATIYVTLNPCNECAKVIVQSGVKNIIFMKKKVLKEVSSEADEKEKSDADEKKKIEAEFIFEVKKNKLKAAEEIFHKSKRDPKQFNAFMAEKLGRAYVPKTINVTLE